MNAEGSEPETWASFAEKFRGWDNVFGSPTDYQIAAQRAPNDVTADYFRAEYQMPQESEWSVGKRVHDLTTDYLRAETAG